MEWNGRISKNLASGKIIYTICLWLDVASVFLAGFCECFGVCDKPLQDSGGSNQQELAEAGSFFRELWEGDERRGKQTGVL